MTGFEPGNVILVPFPFSDLSGVKTAGPGAGRVGKVAGNGVPDAYFPARQGQSEPYRNGLAGGRVVETDHRQAAQDFHH